MKTSREKDKEKCILCKKKTKYFKNTHIDMRKYYIEGAGQLCEKCYKNIYEKNK